MTLPPSTRASLLLRLRDAQDHEAWVEFVSIYEPLALRLLLRSGLQDADAREVMQELFLTVSRSVERWDMNPARGSFRGWLKTVTRNLLLNWLQARKRRPMETGNTDFQQMLDSLPAAESHETQEFENELRKQLFHSAAEQVRGEVAPSTWRAFWETAVEGASVAETAAKLSLSVGAVKVAKCRVLARLRDAVSKLDDEK